ncbi:MAG: hypothetical protein F4X20_04760 [Dehalococcoidia bacterium]|nr:hypothetical protein [Dehalococcoidia bacterium]
MTTTMQKQTTDADPYSRPAAQFTEDGVLEIRASASGDCRRALWYAATGHPVTNPPTNESATVMEAGIALEPVVLRAMERAGWDIQSPDRDNPTRVAVSIGRTLRVTGHPDATGVMPIFGGETVIEVKTRNPDAFKRWQMLGAERSHPNAVAQVATYTLGTYGEMRDAVIACMDTGSRAWDYEVIPAERLEKALQDTSERLGELAVHHALVGPDPDALPDRDFTAESWQCRGCPFLAECQPEAAETSAKEEEDREVEEVSDDDVRQAVANYLSARDAVRGPEQAKRAALTTLKAWMTGRDSGKAEIDGHTVSLVQSRRYAVDHRKLNALLDPETRAEIVTEHTSEYVRVS